jgi:uncharacterized protein YjbJ (UPF0337 family)
MHMNKETVQGSLEQGAGKVKQRVGEAVGNQKLANAGAADQVKGAARETWGRVKETARDVAEKHAKAEASVGEHKERAAESAQGVRAKVVSSAQKAKDSITRKLDDIKHKHAS